MAFCSKCGAQLNEGASFCSSCGNNIGGGEYRAPLSYHKVPKCTHCGHIGEWNMGPVIRPVDFLIGIPLCILGIVPGLVYFIVVAAIRSNKDNREKICKNCKAKNLFTFEY